MIDKIHYWKADHRWEGNDVFIIGGGPSVNAKNYDFDLIKDRRVIGVNNAYGLRVSDEKGNLVEYHPRTWVDICFFGDARWFTWHKHYLSKFKNLIFSCAIGRIDRPLVQYIKRGKSTGIERRPDCVAWNRCSGGAAINLAYHLGAKRVILLGFDMKQVDGKDNYHPDHKSKQRRTDNKYIRYIEAFGDIAKDAEKYGLEILNATPGSALMYFPFVDLKEFIEGP